MAVKNRRKRKPDIIIIYPPKYDGGKKYAEDFAKRGYIAITRDYNEVDFKLTPDEINLSL